VPAKNVLYNPTSKLPMVKMTAIVWAVLGILMGSVQILFMNDMMAYIEGMLDMSIPGMKEMWDSLEPMMLTIYWVSGMTSLISGILAAVCAICCHKKRYYVVAIMTAVIGSLLVVISIYGLVGLIMAHYLSKSKKEFSD